MNSSLRTQAQAVVLVIESDHEIVAGLAIALGRAGYSARCCRDAEAALDFVDHTSPDLIIADVNLQGASGIQLCDRIRQRDGLGEVPVMFLSAAQGPDIIRRSYATGAAYYLRKPLDPDVLLELIDKALAAPGLVASAGGGDELPLESIAICSTNLAL